MDDNQVELASWRASEREAHLKAGPPLTGKRVAHVQLLAIFKVGQSGLIVFAGEQLVA